VPMRSVEACLNRVEPDYIALAFSSWPFGPFGVGCPAGALFDGPPWDAVSALILHCGVEASELFEGADKPTGFRARAGWSTF
jgi:hypothetical protein